MSSDTKIDEPLGELSRGMYRRTSRLTWFILGWFIAGAALCVALLVLPVLDRADEMAARERGIAQSVATRCEHATAGHDLLTVGDSGVTLTIAGENARAYADGDQHVISAVTATEACLVEVTGYPGLPEQLKRDVGFWDARDRWADSEGNRWSYWETRGAGSESTREFSVRAGRPAGEE